MQSIVDAKGCVVPGLGNSGKRYDSSSKKSENWGGKRVRSSKAAVEHWIHEDAVECPAEIIKEAVLKYEMVKKDNFKEEVKNEKKEAYTRTLKKEVKEDHLYVDRLVKKDDFKEVVKDEKKEVYT